MLLGAIDVGTNSIHLIVVEMDSEYGTSRTILKAREMVRLGGGDALATGTLAKKPMQRGVEAIVRFAEAARAAGAIDIHAVATSAVRESRNGPEFVAAVEAASGVRIEVLDSVEEARLIHLGVSRGFSLDGRVGCIFDIGGGSTEFIVGDARRAYFLHSVKLGSLRLYDDFLREDGGRPSRGYAELERHIADVLAPVAEQISEFRFDVLVGTSGTALGLAALEAAASGATPERAHGYVVRVDRLRALQDEMRALSPAERRKMPGMNPRRSDIIVAGNAIVLGVAKALGRDTFAVSERALREGIVVDYLERNAEIARRLGGERARRLDAAHALARRFGELGPHARNVAALAVALFDGTTELHRFEPADRDVLFAAALVHDVGRAVAASAHHKHGAYIVRNAGLDGWRAEEIDLIASLVRYHRKALPKSTHPEWEGAAPAARAKIEGLGALLRLADGLDRRHLGLVASLRVRTATDVVTLSLEAGQDVAPEIEAARFKSDLFRRAFARELAFEVTRKRDDGAFDDAELGSAELGAAAAS